MKRFTQLNPYLFCFLSILISIVVWDFLKLNYDVNNIIQGAAYDEKINSLNNTLRVFFFNTPLATSASIYLYKSILVE